MALSRLPVCKHCRLSTLLLLLTALILAPQARAADAACPDAQLLSGRLITDICWSCLFPVRIAGMPIGGGRVPEGASKASVCVCRDGLGVPRPGFTLGLWEPARIIELVRNPTCTPALGGIRLPFGDVRLLGSGGQGELDDSEAAFYNVHVYAFPLLVMLDLFFDDRCNPDGFSELDLLHFTELDPTWNNAELGFFAHPEATWLASPAAQAACLADGVAASAGKPIDELFWCAGTWGLLYPFAGAQPTLGSRVRATSLSATRVMAALHRRGLARQTMGDGALCGAPLAPFLPKSQYKLSMFYPLPEANSAHVIGESPFRWGIHRTYPGPGEDHLYVLWRWQDCCATF
jgi:conjugal transfer pilus assembly protein TraU